MGIPPGPGHNNSSSSNGQLICDRDWLAIGRALKLSPRQLQIARLIMEEDLQVKQIARRLKITKRSVTTALERMYKKLDVHTRAALISRLWQTERQLRVGAGSSV